MVFGGSDINIVIRATDMFSSTFNKYEKQLEKQIR